MKNLLVFLLLLCAPSAWADHDITSASDRGTYVDIARVTGSSVAGTAFASALSKRMDGVYFNNTASTIWIGTTTATLNGVVHSNIANGLPVLSSATFKLDGKMTGAISFTCNLGVATCEVRSLEGLNR